MQLKKKLTHFLVCWHLTGVYPLIWGYFKKCNDENTLNL